VVERTGEYLWRVSGQQVSKYSSQQVGKYYFVDFIQPRSVCPTLLVCVYRDFASSIDMYYRSFARMM